MFFLGMFFACVVWLIIASIVIKINNDGFYKTIDFIKKDYENMLDELEDIKHELRK
ncbi:hypothetical protein phiOC_p310 [Ochrobactrum phage vB_OspM_OC]|nr:hypothetical protein phiOC_p310 [Ochrobactrum phage vB_OspM_OC]